MSLICLVGLSNRVPWSNSNQSSVLGQPPTCGLRSSLPESLVESPGLKVQYCIRMQTSRFHNQMTLRSTLSVPDSLYWLFSHLGPATGSESLVHLERSHPTAKFPSCLFSVIPALPAATCQGFPPLSWPEGHPSKGTFTSPRRKACRRECAIKLYITISRVCVCPKHSFLLISLGGEVDYVITPGMYALIWQHSPSLDISHLILITILWGRRCNYHHCDFTEE